MCDVLVKRDEWAEKISISFKAKKKSEKTDNI